jgi:cysteine-rich repeat protein
MPTPRTRTPRLARWLALALAASATTCFTGDDLVGQPCRSDADCNPPLDVLGAYLRCQHDVCGYSRDCGDGIVDEEEACDLGAANVNDDYAAGPGMCSVQCRELPWCGDGEVDPPETCDDADDDDADECPRTCQTATCGDGFVQAGVEACDDGDADELACTQDCRLPSCGNGVRDELEACDDGDRDDTDDCLSTCVLPSCGDGFVGPGEACDDRNADNQDACLDTCDENTCGDGFVGPGEACDDGDDDDEDDCTNACALPTCGDGVTQPPEECDDDNDNNEDDCLSTCVRAACGDGHVWTDVEACDDHNTSNQDACLDTCDKNTCGDGFVGPAEACDDGDDDDDDDCTNACALPTCGDALLQPGEDCDYGDKVDGDGCSSVCKKEGCGDGVTQPGEECDDGDTDNGDGCSKKCEFESCGDGVTQAPEACDDGNPDNGDDCVHCAKATCGDGVLWTKKGGAEQCDDGNDDDSDACVACNFAVCGDGHVRTDAEACDNGNDDNSDACLDDCTAATCGDGFTGPGEQCDDGDMSDLDPCKHDCTKNYCGDGLVDAAHEGCDDQNSEDDDGCSNACEQGAGAIGGGPHARHFCAIREGQVRCWGNNAGGQLGVGSTANVGDEPGELPAKAVDVPVNLPGTRVVKVTSGGLHTCVILEFADPNAARGVRCWGDDSQNQLGVPGFQPWGDDPGEPPAPLVALDAVDIAAGRYFTCVALASGGVRCWGTEFWSGELGQPGVSGELPTAIADLQLGGGAAVQVAASEDHACARLADGAVRCWGSNGRGKLGLKKTFADLQALGDDEHPSDQPPVELGGEAIHIAAGGDHTCAVRKDGRLLCWGDASYGVLGYGNSKDIGDDEHPKDAGPVKMLGDTDVVTRVVTSPMHTCALLDDGSVRCWGYGGLLGLNNKSGYGDTPGKPPPVPLDGAAIDLVAGGLVFGEANASTCALLHRGRVRCWGRNDSGQLGRGHTDQVGDGPGEMPPPNSAIYFNP